MQSKHLSCMSTRLDRRQSMVTAAPVTKDSRPALGYVDEQGLRGSVSGVQDLKTPTPLIGFAQLPLGESPWRHHSNRSASDAWRVIRAQRSLRHKTSPE